MVDPREGPTRPPDPRPSLSIYYNSSRLRSDAWLRLKAAVRLLKQARRAGKREDERHAQVNEILDELTSLEDYWAFPGKLWVRELRVLLKSGHLDELSWRTRRLVRVLMNQSYRLYEDTLDPGVRRPKMDGSDNEEDDDSAGLRVDERPYFEVLIVDEISATEETDLKIRLRELRRPEDHFVYDVVVVPTFEDAIIAILLNYHIQSVVIRYGFPFRSRKQLGFVRRILADMGDSEVDSLDDTALGLQLGRTVQSVRPTLDLYLVSDAPVEAIAGNLEQRFRRIFYRQEDYRELHLSILKGIHSRYRTPFFDALRTYTQKPTGVFHALPISRAKSISKSHWIRDMEQFYGNNVFLAETSATTAGLDSLLQPHGSLREAQDLAARAFGARRSYFVTNGTSTANKIVLQAVVRPGDIVLAARDCHTSHHYSLMLAGAYPIYMDPYPITQYSIYGGVPIKVMKRHLLELRREGKLDRVRAVLLTNCSFDGIVYHPERVMQELLAIKPDLVFVWDEAWFAFAYFTPITRRRTGMGAAQRLKARFESDTYRRSFEAWQAEFNARLEDAEARGASREEIDDLWLTETLLPDPSKARVRVYVTQSTHKTLTSLRQGSMIHVRDVDFDRLVRSSFEQSYFTHTSTSANYQILASLDLGRRQVEMEGYELVQHQSELAVTLRARINTHPLLTRFFKVLAAEDLIPEEYRRSGFQGYRELNTNWARLDRAWEEDEFCLEPSRLTLSIGPMGLDGTTFKKRLIESFDIQINKTSRNTVLFMTHIGTTRGASAYLLEVLHQLASEARDRLGEEADLERSMREDSVRNLTEKLPPLPDFSRFHEAFHPEGSTHEGDLRKAFYAACEDSAVEFLRLDGSVEKAMASGREIVSAGFITPYPPGFPLLVPGQILSREILAFLRALDVKEIHGYEPAHGLRIFREDALIRFLNQSQKPSCEKRSSSQ